jgi:hypothetical protein
MNKSKFGFLIIGIPVGIALFCFRSCVPSYEEKDLKSIQVKVKSIKEHLATRMKGDALIFQFDKMKGTYEIGEYNYYYFKKELFKKNVKIGDSVRVLIPKDLPENGEEVTPIYDINKGDISFLTKAESISIFSNTRKYILWGAVFALFLGFARLIYWFVKK